MPEKDLLKGIDFGELARRQARASTFQPRSAEEWGQRAERRSRREKGSDYAREFLARMDLEGVETVLDVGCGSGNLALPLARRVRRVVCIDFSAEMLRLLRANARAEGVVNVTARKLSWADDWSRLPRADAAICSRAMDTGDLRGALEKLDSKARVRCYVTMHAGATFMSEEVYRVLGRTAVPRPNYMYAVNVLYQMGIRARVDFLRTTGGLQYESAEQFAEGIRWRLGKLSAAEEKRLVEYYESLPREADGTARYRHEFEWAMLSWEKTPRRAGGAKEA